MERRSYSIKSFICPFYFFHTPSENTEMLQREVSDSTWKETNRRKQPLYQQMVAIDCGTAQQETNCHRK